MADLRFPIGPMTFDPVQSDEKRLLWIDRIRTLPATLKDAVSGLSEEQLDTPYREGGWTVRQVVHHLADSHLNAYCRFRLTLTEDHPTIRPYDEQAWAKLTDASSGPVDTSLTLLAALHERWFRLLETIELSDYDRTLHHPEGGDMSLWNLLDNYQWHGVHHVAHITALRERKGW